MRAILYARDDAPFIEAVRDLFQHILDCPNCMRLARNEGEVEISEMFGALNAITTDDFVTHDYAKAIAFCDYWLGHHRVLSGLDDMLIATPINDTRH